MNAPLATVRLQFHREFTLDDAIDVVDYYARLGVSHVYASPLQKARAGSVHGYDVVDYDAISPELGGLAALERLVAALRARGMGLILDIVPNHMSASEENAWWYDVLEQGRASAFAGFFDIDWRAPDPDLRGKVLAPFLDRSYADACRDFDISFRADDARLEIAVGGARFPLAPDSYREALAPAAHVARLDSSANPRKALRAWIAGGGTEEIERAITARNDDRGGDWRRMLLDRQHYRLAHWRDAADRINWRRFFDINGLIRVCVERTRVFDAVHRLPARLFAERLIDGVRVDHVDGLADPRAYCRRLRRTLGKADDSTSRRPYIVVEKILASDERLREDWDVDGTTGYDFMDRCSAVLHDGAGAPLLDEAWIATGGPGDFAELAVEMREDVAASLFRAELGYAVDAWRSDARADRSAIAAFDSTAERALVKLLARLDVYRTYVDRRGASQEDRDRLERAAQRATRDASGEERAQMLDLLGRLVATPPPRAATHRRLARSFQQLSPPVAAKGVEDTAFYRYGRLLSRNEVGSDPARLALPVAAFHARSAGQLDEYPDGLLATATHDHKRGEDARMRLAVLSECPLEWAQLLARWRAAQRDLVHPAGGIAVPTPAHEAMLLQTIIGAWPLDLRADDSAALEAFKDRLATWQRKALREEKLVSSWFEPSRAREDACEHYLREGLSSARPIVREVEAFVDRIAPAGAVNGLSQAVLRMTTPGVPDLYQGCDYWDFSLVDPDNRRAVDHHERAQTLDRGDDIDGLVRDWRSGVLKQRVIERVLTWRRDHADLARRGAYRPVTVSGTRAESALAFVRRDAKDETLVVVARHAARLVADIPVIPSETWQDTRLELDTGARWQDVITARRPAMRDATLLVRDVLDRLPVAVLVRSE